MLLCFSSLLRRKLFDAAYVVWTYISIFIFAEFLFFFFRRILDVVCCSCIAAVVYLTRYGGTRDDGKEERCSLLFFTAKVQHSSEYSNNSSGVRTHLLEPHYVHIYFIRQVFRFGDNLTQIPIMLSPKRVRFYEGSSVTSPLIWPRVGLHPWQDQNRS